MPRTPLVLSCRCLCLSSLQPANPRQWPNKIGKAVTAFPSFPTLHFGMNVLSLPDPAQIPCNHPLHNLPFPFNHFQPNHQFHPLTSSQTLPAVPAPRACSCANLAGISFSRGATLLHTKSRVRRRRRGYASRPVLAANRTARVILMKTVVLAACSAPHTASAPHLPAHSRSPAAAVRSPRMFPGRARRRRPPSRSVCRSPRQHSHRRQPRIAAL